MAFVLERDHATLNDLIPLGSTRTRSPGTFVSQIRYGVSSRGDWRMAR